MDDTHGVNASSSTFGQVSWKQFTEVLRSKRVQIQLAGNWQRNRPVLFDPAAHGVEGGGIDGPASGAVGGGSIVVGGDAGGSCGGGAGREAGFCTVLRALLSSIAFRRVL